MQIEHLPILWVIIAIVFAVAEMILPFFGAIFGAVAALVVAAVSLSPVVIWQFQIVIFAIVMLVSMVYLRPLVLARMKTSKGVPSLTDALMGKQGVVTVALDPISKMGRALIEGNDWAVKGDSELAVNTKVTVVGHDGIVLKVKG